MTAEKTSRNNTVRLVGVIKENNLEVVKTAKGDEQIRGSLIVATSEIESHKVQFFVNKTTRNGEMSKDFVNLGNLLPENTISVASFLAANKTATYDIAAKAASKVWVLAHFDEYASRVGEREKSMVTLKGFKAGFKQDTDKSPYVPTAEFTVDVYVNSVEEEKNTEGKSTGRAVLEGLIPTYNGSVMKIKFIAPEENNIAKFVLANYGVSDTVTLTGDIVSLQEKIIKQDSADDFFGRSHGTQYETRFVRERRIAGGSKNPIHLGEENCITAEEIKAGLAARELRMIDNGSKNRKSSYAPKAPTANVEQSSAASKTKIEDFDF